ncbi:MAG: hypothetical protein ABL921_01035 [Pirellula sp.]
MQTGNETGNDRGILRRSLLQSAAGLAFGSWLVAQDNALTKNDDGVGNGRPGDFDFLQGEWRISHRRRTSTDDEKWDEFSGTATCWSILNGIGSIEELRIPDRKFYGMGLRLLDVEKKIWHDHWVNRKSGILTTPGQTGGFVDGVGTFVAEDRIDDKRIQIKGVWDRITNDSCRWYQTISEDGGVTWRENWFMDWRRQRSTLVLV